MITMIRQALKAKPLIQPHRLFSATATATAAVKKDYYQILGLEKNANDAQIK